jgi:uncharacterized cupin superfamily protein
VLGGGGLVHRDEVDEVRAESPRLAFGVRDIGAAAGSTVAGLRRIEVEAGGVAPPYGAIEGIAPSEEIGFVLDGEGQLEQHDGPEIALHAGQAFVRHAMDRSFVYRANDEGLDFLTFGANLPMGPVAREGPVVASLADAEEDVEDRGEFGWHERDLGGALGSVLAGLRYATLPPWKMSTPPHWHSGEHELFVVLEGEGSLLLYDMDGNVGAEHQLRPGHVISRPAGTSVAHALRAGHRPLTYLAYGTRKPDEVTFYPRSQKAYVSGVLMRVQRVADYWEGEA